VKERGSFEENIRKKWRHSILYYSFSETYLLCYKSKSSLHPPLNSPYGSLVYTKLYETLLMKFVVYCMQEVSINQTCIFFKQFVVTNCSKERPASIVTETVKNSVLIPIVTSKESHLNVDFKYISFIKKPSGFLLF